MKIKAPINLCLYTPDSLIDTLCFIDDLYHYDEDSIQIDFSKTENVTAAAALAIFAHVNRIQYCKQNAGYFQFSCKESPVYEKVFIKAQFLKCLLAGTKEKLEKLRQEDCNFQSDFELIESRKYLLSHLDKIKRELIKEHPSQHIEDFFKHLRSAISEILINTDNHAYLEIEDEKQWWFAFWHNRKENTILFIIYDLGIGIVESYKSHATNQSNKIKKQQPLDIFKEALQAGNSRFTDDGRGYGLSNLLKIPTTVEGIALLIHSGLCSVYRNSEKETFTQHPSPLPGTLIEWSFDLPKED